MVKLKQRCVYHKRQGFLRGAIERASYILHSVTSSNVLRKGSLQTKLNAGFSEQEQEDLFQKMNVVSTK